MVLLKNDGALPLDAGTTRDVAVIGPLADTLYTDWYGGALPYGVTPLDGITTRLGDGATVTGTEGVDRIALKEVTSGRYVTGGAEPGGGPLALTATTAEPTTQFDVFDWGQGVVTLRNVANGKVVGLRGNGFANDQAQPNGWFVQQQFRVEDRPDGSVVLRYVGYDATQSWSAAFRTPYLTVQADGTLALGAATADAATAFSRETITSGTDAAVAAASAADAAVVVVGSMPFINGREDHDRTTTDLAEGQQALVEAVLAANPNTVVVLETSYPDSITWIEENVPAVVWTTHAGQETGNAVADVLFGDVNPAGRVTQTWCRSTDDLPADLLDYDIIRSGQTYLYDDETTPLYAFGHGLSYTTFEYSRLRLDDRSVEPGRTIGVSVDVTNTGPVAGDEVVQLYTHQKRSRVPQPVKALRAFDRVHVEAGETVTVRLEVPVEDLAHWDVTRGTWAVETSPQEVMVGASSADIRSTAVVQVRGERIPDRDLSVTTEAEAFDDYAGVRLEDRSKERGTAVEAGPAGGWIAFHDVDLRDRPDTLTATVARAETGTGTVQVRLGSPTGRLVGTATVPSTGDVYAYTTVTAELDRVSGSHDVYLVFDAPMRVADLTLG
jgi:beta-glucosidase